MGIITAHNNMQFEPSDKLFSKIKRMLKTYSQAGLLDVNDFHGLVVEVLDSFGTACLMEDEGILEIVNGKAHLPENFKSLESAWLCKATSNTPIRHQQNAYSFYTDTTYQDVTKRKCSIDCPKVECGTKVTVREYVEGLENIFNYEISQPLSVGTYSSMRPSCTHISTHNGYLHAPFNGSVYIKYYSFPIDEDSGLPLIPNTTSIQLAIQYYIIYQKLLEWYLNDEIPNGVERKAADFKALYKEAWAQASYETKLPSFMTFVDTIRRKRRSFDTFTQTDFDY